MPTLSEPASTALLLATFGVLLSVSALFSRTLERLGVPVVLLFLVVGMLAGSEGLLGIPFDNVGLAFRIGMIALALILFDGGLNTSYSAIRASMGPAGVLATFGVAGTAGALALFARLLGLSWGEALLLGAIVSSTDAAAVFAVLRGGGIRLKRRVGTILEVESGANDPMAVILTLGIIESLTGARPFGWHLLWSIPAQLLVGALVGAGLGLAARALFAKVRLSSGAFYAVLTLALALFAFGSATLLWGSGFLAVYSAGIVLGNGPLPYRGGLTRIHDAIAWLSQISMFLVLGLLVFPSQLLDVAGIGLAAGLFLAFVARPLAVLLCILPFRLPPREVGYICWAGLRGAVPIILGLFPVIYGVPGADRLFHIVFFIVVVSVIVPGATIRPLARRLGLESREAPDPAAVLEINSTQLLKGDILSFYIDSTLAVCDVNLSQISFPEGAAAILIVRGNDLIAARGNTTLRQGDHVYIFCRPEDRPYIELLFGRPQDGSAPAT